MYDQYFFSVFYCVFLNIDLAYKNHVINTLSIGKYFFNSKKSF